MEFLSTPIDDFFDSSLPYALGSGIDISRCDGNNVSHDGGISNEMKMPKSKVPRGLLLFRDEVYDVDGRPDGELPPQLEVRPIAKYVSDPGLVLGRQIAVNRSYICYGLKMGNIRVLNISSALRSLLRGHTQVAFSVSCLEIVHGLLSSLVLCILLEDASHGGRS